ncbi:MBOAT family O-acyltransferase [Treponema sp.]|uniref:MBOAT family O-acyltransferase n=1 Tax=Treponema sp. TaxID=166 RepID=UPI003F019AC6
MLDFKSYTFICFLIVSLLCYYAVPKKHQWKIILIANIVFYAFSGIPNFVFILFTSAVTFFGAASVNVFQERLKQKKSSLSKEDFKDEKENVKRRKRLILAVVLVCNVGVLAYLKYWNAIIQFFSVKVSVSLDFLYFAGHKTLLLPLGISFYTFQTISYFMDVYNGKYAPEKNFLKYFLFVSFFPQLIMGPINRFDKMSGQLTAERSFDLENIKHGVLLILFGAMKKYCIADLIVNRISSVLDHSYTNLPGCLILFGVLGYSIYQYADFSGGIDMVLGIAELFGIKMQPNFRQPYFSTSLADFWRRWHISLGLWMKDYVFFPFALTKNMQNIGKWCASHLGKHFARTVPAGIANIVVFLLVGIWHGPELHYVVWGLYNGLVIAFSDMLKPAFDRLGNFLHINVKSRGFHIFQIIRTFIVVNIGAYFDRIYDVPKSFLYLKRTFTDFGPLSLLKSQSYLKEIFGSFRDVESQLVLIFISGIIVFVTSILKERNIDVYDSIQKKGIVVRWAAYYFPLILVILSMSFSPGNAVFMYAQY